MTDTPTLMLLDDDGELTVLGVPDVSTYLEDDVPVVALTITPHNGDEPRSFYVPLADVDRLITALRTARDDATRGNR
ncbi:hypothetical protein [Streptomyces sp. NPDC054784]